MLSVVGAPERACNRCREVLPLRAFGKDARNKSGHRGVCKRCDRRATRVRRTRTAVADLTVVRQAPRPPRDPADLMLTAAETTIGALNPPAGDLDAVLVLMLRNVADLADRAFEAGDVQDFGRCGTLLLRILRELLATRATHHPRPAPTIAAKSNLDHFRRPGDY